MELRVVAMTWEAEGVLGLSLALADGGRLPSWTPGAHVDVDLAPGLRRQYSLCGNPAEDRRWRLAVLHEPAGRGGSDFVHTRLRPGAILTVSGPRNNFPLLPAGEYLFVAGGIGVTPLVPMVADVAAKELPWRLLYGGRRRAAMAFVDVVASYGRRALVRPEEEFGLLPVERAVRESGTGAVVYCCGPEPLLSAVEDCCARHGRELRVERFAPKSRTAPAGPDAPFDVVCRRSGVHVPVGAGQSVLAALEEAGLPVVSSCMEGTCGTCETAVLDGDIDHRDSLLSEDERQAGDTMLICVSRSRSPRLVLDL